MKIGISGCSSQGKTTLINALINEPLFTDYTFCKSPGRIVQSEINENGNDLTQLLIMTEHYKNYGISNNVVFDRCALDCMAYGMANLFRKFKEGKEIDEEFNSNVIFPLYLWLMRRYDAIFYLAPELPVVSDGVRSSDLQYFAEVTSSFNTLIKEQSNFPTECQIITIKGSVQKRVESILDFIKESQ